MDSHWPYIDTSKKYPLDAFFLLTCNHVFLVKGRVKQMQANAIKNNYKASFGCMEMELVVPH